MIDPKTGRRWNVISTSYFGTPPHSAAKTRQQKAEFAMEGGPNTALGDRVSRGDIAVPKNIPLGSVIYVPGYGWGIAKDHGGAIKGNRIDLATGGVIGNKVNPEARQAALNWGRKNQTVYVFPVGHQIPKDHAPPQAFLNDLRRAKNGEAPIKAQSEKTINTAAVSENKPLPIAMAKRVGKVAPYKPLLPKDNSSSEKADKTAYFKLLDEGNGRDYNNNGFIDLSEKAAGNYEGRLDRILAKGRYGSDSWTELQKQIDQIRDGVTYQTHKKRIDSNHASYLDKRLTDARKELTLEGKIQPNNYKVGEYKKGDGSPESKFEWPDPVAIPKTTPVSSLASPVTNDVSIPNPATKEISLSGLGQEIALNPSAFTPTKTLRTKSPIATDEKSTVTQNPESDSKSLAGSTGALLQTVKSGTPTSRPMSVSTPPSALTQTVQTEKPTPPEQKTAQPQPSALTQYIKEINETDRIKADSVKGKKQYAIAAKSFNDVRKRINSSDLSEQQKATLRKTQGNFPYRD